MGKYHVEWYTRQERYAIAAYATVKRTAVTVMRTWAGRLQRPMRVVDVTTGEIVAES